MSRRRKKRIEIQQKYLLLALTILCVILMVLSLFFGSAFRPIRTITDKLIRPMQKGVNSIGIWVEDKIETFKDYDHLKEENEKYKAKLDEYEDKIKNYQQNAYELERLQALYDLDAQYADYPKTVARVIAKDPGNWFDNFYIDKGSNDGIQVGCNVLYGNGLMGIVTEVDEEYSKIRAIIDDTSNVSAMVLPSEAICNVSGSLTTYTDGYLIAEHIDKDADIEVGDQIVTSYISDKYHQGITIGYIDKIENDSNNLTKTAYIIPAAEFSNIQEVLIILETRKNIEE